ncbi:hypothetical protein J31TS4_09470 [Paenibacillus sp. J31TS4]|uniref:hypothetical protein n=1 Tax=Paenibacillus sp. J31TS4 TaxID=2807195 RepID=UPI001B1741AC|nr:hypothetical protein [Paenibacillus sp. J31TS4]GIP37667.1 hypothetical protein J31TS4_09470 [Paenibacillus sp. J31TS4]
MESTVQQIIVWLESKVNRTLQIRKEEQGDVDEVELKLDKVVLAVRNETHPDDYEARQSIILNGEGQIRGEDEPEPLPNNLYEVPFDDSIRWKSDGNGIHLQTNRASYAINVL